MLPIRQSSRARPAAAAHLLATVLAASCSLVRALVPESSSLLVVGASGGTGARAIRGLLDVGYAPAQLIVTSRDPSKPTLARLRELGVEIRSADLDDPASLVGIGAGCTGCYLHSTAGDTKKLDTGEVTRARNLAEALRAEGTPVAFNSAAAEPEHRVQRIAQKHEVERVFTEAALPATHLRANLFMEELWKGYTRPQILKGKYPFSVPPDRPIFLTSVRDLGRIAGTCLAVTPPSASGCTFNVASDVLTPVQLAAAFAAAQGTPCVHKRARLLRLIARVALPDLYEVIQFYRTSTETTDIEALEQRFPQLLTRFDSFLEETRWADENATYEDLALL